MNLYYKLLIYSHIHLALLFGNLRIWILLIMFLRVADRLHSLFSNVCLCQGFYTDHHVAYVWLALLLVWLVMQAKKQVLRWLHFRKC